MPTYLNTSAEANPETRAKPRVNVIRGYGGNETTSLSRSLPATVAIKSGQLIAATATGWVLAINTHTVGQIHVAYHDSTDTDVASSGKLLGFSVQGRYELETGYSAADVYAVGTPVYANVTGAATAGYCTKTNTGGTTPVIGYAAGPLVDWSKPQYGTGSAPYAADNLAQNTEAKAANSKVLRFTTGG
jgi:hypothetical protein